MIKSQDSPVVFSAQNANQKAPCSYPEIAHPWSQATVPVTTKKTKSSIKEAKRKTGNSISQEKNKER